MSDRVADALPLASWRMDFYLACMRPCASLLFVAMLSGCSDSPSAAPPIPTPTAQQSVQTETSGPPAPPERDAFTGNVIGGWDGQDFTYKFPRRQRPGDPVDNPTLRPVLIRKVDPDYTDEARKARVSGIVVLQIVIEADGRVSGGYVLKPLPMGLTQKAIDAVEKWKYEPAVHKGLPVRTNEIVKIAFRPE